LTYFGKTIDSLDLRPLRRFVNRFINGLGIDEASLPDIKNVYMQTTKSNHLKAAILLEMERKIKKLRSFLDDYNENIFEKYMHYIGFCPQLSMDILLERGEKVYITPDFPGYQAVRTAFVQLLYMNINSHISQFKIKTMKSKSFYFRFFNSKITDLFFSVTLPQLMEYNNQLDSYIQMIDFRKMIAKPYKEIPNPLKILEFIRNSNSKEVSEFMRVRPVRHLITFNSD